MARRNGDRGEMRRFVSIKSECLAFDTTVYNRIDKASSTENLIVKITVILKVRRERDY